MNEEVMRRYRHPVCQADVAAFCRKYEGAADGRLIRADGDNPFCGDTIQLAAWVTDEGMIRDLCYEGYGCSLCMASAEALVERAKGQPLADSLTLTEKEILERLGGLTVGRSRMNCVTLALTVLQKAARDI